MKNYNIFLLILICGLFFACEDWISKDIEPQGEFLEENYFQNDKQTESVLNAAYMYQRQQFSQDGIFGVGYMGWGFMSNFPSDDVHPGGQGLSDFPQLQDLGEYDWTPANIPIYYFWRKNYYSINRCNLVLHNPQYESEKLSELQAEARFLRALGYFQLIQLFRDVPLIDHPLTFDEFNQEKADYQEVFKLVVNDLKLSKAVLKTKTELSRDEMYKPTVGAAQSLLGKVYLFMASPYYNMGAAYYDSARMELADVVSSDIYGLEDDFDDVWHIDHEHGKESIFEIEYSEAVTYGGWDHGLWISGNMEVQMGGVRMSGSDTLSSGCWGWSIPTQNLLDAYDDETDNVRKDGTVLQIGWIESTGGTLASNDYPEETFANAYSKKRTNWSYLMSESSPQFGWPTNERLLRYADVLLMYSEALLKSGSGDELGKNADFYLSEVRFRAKLEKKTGITMEDIMLERRLELAFEGHRWPDLVRWNVADNVLNQFVKDDGVGEVISPFIKGRHEHYPIPEIEVSSSEGKLVQNPAY